MRIPINYSFSPAEAHRTSRRRRASVRATYNHRRSIQREARFATEREPLNTARFEAPLSPGCSACTRATAGERHHRVVGRRIAHKHIARSREQL